MYLNEFSLPLFRKLWLAPRVSAAALFIALQVVIPESYCQDQHYSKNICTPIQISRHLTLC